MPQAEQTATLQTSLQCSNCGAILHFAPGTHHLKCSYCGVANEIADTVTGAIVSFDYEEFIADKYGGAAAQTANIVSCRNCGASTTLPPEVNSDSCAFCASPLIINEAESREIVKPHYILPFVVPQPQALDSFRKWLKNLWFAPSDLSRIVRGDARQFKGVYIPHWSYDTDTVTHYTGSRGEYYYVTESYTENVNGRMEVRTRQVRHTAWHPASGTVDCAFNDILVSASHSLPQKVANRLEPWRLETLVHYNEQYVSGFRSELYQIDAAAGFEAAKQEMDPVIREAILRDIGGDEQRITGYDNSYNHIALKYLLLPTWISAYKYKDKLYHFTVNACTGEVVGERPYSALKITLAVIAGIALLVWIFMLLNQ